MNIGDTFATGPTEAAYVIDERVKLASVIASHANDEASQGDKAIAGALTETFINAANAPVHVPLNGRDMEFDGAGMCVAGY